MNIFRQMRWTDWRKPQGLVVAAALAALIALTWLAVGVADRVAAAALILEQAYPAAGRSEADARQAQARARLMIELRRDLRELKFAVAGAMAGNILLLLFAILGYRLDFGERPAALRTQDRARSDAHARPALLDDLSRLLQSSIDYADAYQVVERCAAGIFAPCGGALFLSLQAGGEFALKAAWGASTHSRERFASADCWAVRRGDAYLAAASLDPVCAHMQPPHVPSLCVPVMGQGAVLGVLVLEDASQPGVLESLRPAAKSFANQIGLAFANMNLQRTLRDLSVRDPLTGLFNRRYMEESLNREIASARRKGRTLGVAICALNQLKRFNETFGPAAGDFALREIAQLVLKQIRSSDIACRYGDAEFVLILPEAPLEAALMRANQLRNAVYALNLEHFGRRLEKLSASFGVALFPQHADDAAKLLRQAQLALAKAGEFGNGRVQSAGPDDPAV